MPETSKNTTENNVQKSGCLFVVSTPIGNLGDISLRAIETLKEVELIATEDTRRASILKKKFDISTNLTSYFEHNAQKRIPKLIEKLQSGKNVALISDAGTPGIADPGYRLITGCIEHDIAVVSIPGPAAFLAALTVSGLPTDRFVFEGFLPSRKGRKKRLTELSQEQRTLLLYESPHRIQRTVEDMYDYCGDRDIVIVREMTKYYEEITRTQLSQASDLLRGKKPKGEYVLVVRGAAKKK